jgi:CheY-like chemotaxis protein
MQILVVDDNRDSAITCCQFLQACGHDARAAFSGPEAVILAQSFCPQVIVLDIGMPGMDGYQVARELRDLTCGQQCILIAVTGWGQERDKVRAMAAGFDHHLTKPIDPLKLESVLREAAVSLPPVEDSLLQ